MIRIITTALLLVLITSCGESATEKLIKELNSSYIHDETRIELIGYIHPSPTTSVSDNVITLGLYSVAGQRENALANIYISFGQDSNSVYIPKKYHSSDIEIYDNEGNRHGYLTKVKIAGIAKYTNKNWAEIIEKGINEDPRKPKAIIEMQRKAYEARKTEAQEREKKTGDPNDYTFYIAVETITIP